jgi:hypothetical protein
MSESKDYSYENELTLLHERLRELQHQNEALKLKYLIKQQVTQRKNIIFIRCKFAWYTLQYYDSIL